MKTYDERTQEILGKITRRRRQRKAVLSITALTCVVALALVLFLPYNTNPPSMRQYSGSEYYSLIRKISEATYEKPRYANNYEKWFAGLNRISDALAIPAPGASPDGFFPGMIEEGADFGDLNTGTSGENTYQEVTDNQVAGVIEGDIIKRTNRHIFYLRGNVLSVYDIARENSKEVGTYAISFDNEATVSLYADVQEMYLSTDGTAVTLLVSGWGDVLEKGNKEAFLCAITLDASNPEEKLTETGRVYLTGSYLSSRLVDGKLLLMSQFRIGSDINFDQEETYLPRLGTPGDLKCVAAEDIIAPETLSDTQYTVVTMLDQKDLDVMDTAAFLSYSQELYVSKEHIFASRSYTAQDDAYARRAMTEISCVSYSGEALEYKGSAAVEGTVKNQYSMDEYEGVLRVVTSTNNVKENDNGMIVTAANDRNASLFCISLEDFNIIASVEQFAPAGEQAESVRFDGDMAYVCTAEVITLTDPVYYFDLSDLSNITWKDTGTIDGYSSSLVNFGDYLLGIGYNASRCLKIEIYQETETGVESVASYERDCGFSEEYKSYLIDREDQLVGLGVQDYNSGVGNYILLHFDGYQLRELVVTELSGVNAQKRAVLIDGWLYLFGEYGQFKVEAVW